MLLIFIVIQAFFAQKKDQETCDRKWDYKTTAKLLNYKVFRLRSY